MMNNQTSQWKKQNWDFWNNIGLSAFFREENHETEDSYDSHLHQHCVQCILTVNQSNVMDKKHARAMPKLAHNENIEIMIKDCVIF